MGVFLLCTTSIGVFFCQGGLHVPHVVAFSSLEHSWPFLTHIFGPDLVLTFALSFSVHCFSPTLGKPRKLSFYGHPYFDPTRRNMEKN